MLLELISDAGGGGMWTGNHSENPGKTSVPVFICETCSVLSMCLWLSVPVCVNVCVSQWVDCIQA